MAFPLVEFFPEWVISVLLPGFLGGFLSGISDEAYIALPWVEVIKTPEGEIHRLHLGILSNIFLGILVAAIIENGAIAMTAFGIAKFSWRILHKTKWKKDVKIMKTQEAKSK